MVHKSGLAWFAGCHCKFSVLAKHVDKGRFADVGPADEGELRKFLFRLLGNPRAAARK